VSRPLDAVSGDHYDAGFLLQVVVGDNLVSMVRLRRAEAGLSQAELAARAGVSRQALSAIEAGRQTPSTALALQLARALRCTVDDLFRLPGGPVVHATLAEPVDQGGRVVLGRVEGRLVAHPLRADSESADGALAGPASRDGTAVVELFGTPGDLDNTALVAGCAPLLGVLADRLGRRYRDARARCIPANSGRALELLAADRVHVAGIHLAAGAEAHVSAVRRALPGASAHLVNLARWQQGLVTAPGNPLALRAPTDLERPGLRVVAREAGSGAQILLERVLREASVAAPPPIYVASSHEEVAKLVRWGAADVGVAIEAAALREGLGFVPLSDERFDLVVPASRVDADPIARFLDLIDQPAFRAEAVGLPGYDLSMSGHASYVPGRGDG